MYDRGFQLHFMTVVGTSSAAPILRKYKFHLMADNGQGVFRYDDTPHYPDVRTFPHHKHVGPDETVVESGPLDIEAIIAEIRQHIGDSDRL